MLKGRIAIPTTSNSIAHTHKDNARQKTAQTIFCKEASK